MSKEREALRELYEVIKERHYGRMPEEVAAAMESARTVLQSQEGSEPVAGLPKYLPLDIALSFMTDQERVEYERPGGSAEAIVRVLLAWREVLKRYAASESQEAGNLGVDTSAHFNDSIFRG